MGMFDGKRFNGFARGHLCEMLLEDLWGHYIFNESDMHSSAYYYIREYFIKNGRDRIYVRCEPQLDRKKPDIVIYKDGAPIYALEFKFFSRLDGVRERDVDKDLHKLAQVVKKHQMRWGFFHMVYDAEENFTMSDSWLRKQGLSKISVSGINARRKDSGRRRTRYQTWRSEFDRLRRLHREHK
jgi:hypothetical protein